MHRFAFVVASSLLATFLTAQNDPPKPEKPAEPAKAEKPAVDPVEPEQQTAKQMLARFHPVEGTAKVGSVAEVKLPPSWLWLDGANGRAFLKAIGNEPGSSILGVAIPPDFAAAHAFAVYSYVDDGHVADNEDPDYAALLKDMQDNEEENAERKKAGVATVRVLGWAEAPHYDKAAHKMYWALRLQFSDSDTETLNYNTRVLGRTGHLVVNGVGGMEQLPAIAELSKTLLGATEFVDGQRYTDFKPEYDRIAAYGIGGLIAGKVALKVGLFAKLGVLLVKFIKPLLVGIAVLAGLVVKVVTGRKKSDEPAKA